MATASYSQFILLHPGSKYGPHLDRSGTTYSLSLNGASGSVAHQSNVLWVEWASEVLMRVDSGSLFCSQVEDKIILNTNASIACQI